MEPQSKKASAKSTTRKRTSKARVTAPTVPSSEPTREYFSEATKVGGSARPSSNLQAIIAVRAYELYEKRGGQGGHELDDWLEAEREVLGRQNRRN